MSTVHHYILWVVGYTELFLGLIRTRISPSIVEYPTLGTFFIELTYYVTRQEYIQKTAL